MGNNRNLIALVSYITWIGFFIAYVKGDKYDSFTMHHLNQALVINLASIVGGMINIIPILGNLASGIISAAVLIFDIIGIVRAYRGSMDPLPLIGDIHLIG